MAMCPCGTQLPGRKQKCDACKANPGNAPSGAGPDTAAPDGLHERGLALWAAMGESLSTPKGHVALEACRTADRLDELDRVIAGKGVLNLMRFRVGSDWDMDDGRELTIHVEFANVLAEVRQQAATFAALLGKLDGQPVAAPMAPRAKNPLDQLAERRKQKS